MKHLPLLLLLALVAAIPACDRTPPPPTGAAEDHAPAPTNRIDINPIVRQNLGITFARVERRNIARTLRIPGRFELLPSAERHYAAPAAGRVELLVHQYDRIEPGTPLYRLDSPRWRELQRELAESEAAVERAQAGVDSIGPFQQAHEQHHVEIERAVELWTQRVETLENLEREGGARGEDITQARLSLASARADFAETLEKEAELAAREQEFRTQLAAAHSRRDLLLRSAAALTGLSPGQLTAEDAGSPRWRTLDEIEIRAAAPGTIATLHISSGTYIEETSPILETVQPELVRFRAAALQSDHGRLADGLPANIVSPDGGSLSNTQPIRGTLTLAPTADAARRMIDVIVMPAPGERSPAWARPGISAFAEVTVEGTGREELAIPLAAVVRDGTQRLIFRRDPRDPSKAIRMEADLGLDDGRWIEIKSGVAQGDEVVLDGVYQLMVATSGTITRGGHFHPDGTFHEEDH